MGHIIFLKIAQMIGSFIKVLYNYTLPPMMIFLIFFIISHGLSLNKIMVIILIKGEGGRYEEIHA